MDYSKNDEKRDSLHKPNETEIVNCTDYHDDPKCHEVSSTKSTASEPTKDDLVSPSSFTKLFARLKSRVCVDQWDIPCYRNQSLSRLLSALTRALDQLGLDAFNFYPESRLLFVSVCWKDCVDKLLTSQAVFNWDRNTLQSVHNILEAIIQLFCAHLRAIQRVAPPTTKPIDQPGADKVAVHSNREVPTIDASIDLDQIQLICDQLSVLVDCETNYHYLCRDRANAIDGHPDTFNDWTSPSPNSAVSSDEQAFAQSPPTGQPHFYLVNLINCLGRGNGFRHLQWLASQPWANVNLVAAALQPIANCADFLTSKLLNDEFQRGTLTRAFWMLSNLSGDDFKDRIESDMAYACVWSKLGKNSRIFDLATSLRVLVYRLTDLSPSIAHQFNPDAINLPSIDRLHLTLILAGLSPPPGTGGSFNGRMLALRNLVDQVEAGQKLTSRRRLSQPKSATTSFLVDRLERRCVKLNELIEWIHESKVLVKSLNNLDNSAFATVFGQLCVSLGPSITRDDLKLIWHQAATKTGVAVDNIMLILTNLGAGTFSLDQLAFLLQLVETSWKNIDAQSKDFTNRRSINRGSFRVTSTSSKLHEPSHLRHVRARLLSLIVRLGVSTRTLTKSNACLDLLWRLAVVDSSHAEPIAAALDQQLAVLRDSVVIGAGGTESTANSLVSSSSPMIADQLRDRALPWLRKALENIDKESIAYFMVAYLRSILELILRNYVGRTRRDQLIELNRSHNLISQLLNSLLRHEQSALALHGDQLQSTSCDQLGVQHGQVVQLHLSVLHYLLKTGELTLGIDRVKVMWSRLVASPSTPNDDREQLLSWLTNNLTLLESDTQTAVFTKLMLKSRPKYFRSINGFECFKAFFKKTNLHEGRLKEVGKTWYAESYDLVGLDFLWDLYLALASCDASLDGRHVHSLCSSSGPASIASSCLSSAPIQGGERNRAIDGVGGEVISPTPTTAVRLARQLLIDLHWGHLSAKLRKEPEACYRRFFDRCKQRMDMHGSIINQFDHYQHHPVEQRDDSSLGHHHPHQHGGWHLRRRGKEQSNVGGGIQSVLAKTGHLFASLIVGPNAALAAAAIDDHESQRASWITSRLAMRRLLGLMSAYIEAVEDELLGLRVNPLDQPSHAASFRGWDLRVPLIIRLPSSSSNTPLPVVSQPIQMTVHSNEYISSVRDRANLIASAVLFKNQSFASSGYQAPPNFVWSASVLSLMGDEEGRGSRQQPPKLLCCSSPVESSIKGLDRLISQAANRRLVGDMGFEPNRPLIIQLVDQHHLSASKRPTKLASSSSSRLTTLPRRRRISVEAGSSRSGGTNTTASSYLSLASAFSSTSMTSLATRQPSISDLSQLTLTSNLVLLTNEPSETLAVSSVHHHHHKSLTDRLRKLSDIFQRSPTPSTTTTTASSSINLVYESDTSSSLSVPTMNKSPSSPLLPSRWLAITSTDSLSGYIYPLLFELAERELTNTGSAASFSLLHPIRRLLASLPTSFLCFGETTVMHSSLLKTRLIDDKHGEDRRSSAISLASLLIEASLFYRKLYIIQILSAYFVPVDKSPWWDAPNYQQQQELVSHNYSSNYRPAPILDGGGGASFCKGVPSESVTVDSPWSPSKSVHRSPRNPRPGCIITPPSVSGKNSVTSLRQPPSSLIINSSDNLASFVSQPSSPDSLKRRIQPKRSFTQRLFRFGSSSTTATSDNESSGHASFAWFEPYQLVHQCPYLHFHNVRMLRQEAGSRFVSSLLSRPGDLLTCLINLLEQQLLTTTSSTKDKTDKPGKPLDSPSFAWWRREVRYLSIQIIASLLNPADNYQSPEDVNSSGPASVSSTTSAAMDCVSIDSNSSSGITPPVSKTTEIFNTSRRRCSLLSTAKDQQTASRLLSVLLATAVDCAGIVGGDSSKSKTTKVISPDNGGNQGNDNNNNSTLLTCLQDSRAGFGRLVEVEVEETLGGSGGYRQCGRHKQSLLFQEVEIAVQSIRLFGQCLVAYPDTFIQPFLSLNESRVAGQFSKLLLQSPSDRVRAETGRQLIALGRLGPSRRQLPREADGDNTSKRHHNNEGSHRLLTWLLANVVALDPLTQSLLYSTDLETSTLSSEGHFASPDQLLQLAKATDYFRVRGQLVGWADSVVGLAFDAGIYMERELTWFRQTLTTPGNFHDPQLNQLTGSLMAAHLDSARLLLSSTSIGDSFQQYSSATRNPSHFTVTIRLARQFLVDCLVTKCLFATASRLIGSDDDDEFDPDCTHHEDHHHPKQQQSNHLTFDDGPCQLSALRTSCYAFLALTVKLDLDAFDKLVQLLITLHHQPTELLDQMLACNNERQSRLLMAAASTNSIFWSKSSSPASALAVRRRRSRRLGDNGDENDAVSGQWLSSHSRQHQSSLMPATSLMTNPGGSRLTSQAATNNGSGKGWELDPILRGRQSHGLVGLRNGGATCYMNAILQQLFMQPGLVESLLSITESDSMDEFNLLLQTQRLFGHLLTSCLEFYNPVDFWRSFHPSGSSQPVNPTEQHDSLDFFQTLIDQLDDSVKKLNHEPIFQSVYQGIFSDTKFCDECDHRYDREQAFTALHLGVKSHELTEALNHLFRPELLEGDNAYLCELCGVKRRAVKRMSIQSLPSVLCLQLKRFDFDWERQQSVKFTSYFSFPRHLDMTPYLSVSNQKLSAAALLSPDSSTSSLLQREVRQRHSPAMEQNKRQKVIDHPRQMSHSSVPLKNLSRSSLQEINEYHSLTTAIGDIHSGPNYPPTLQATRSSIDKTSTSNISHPSTSSISSMTTSGVKERHQYNLVGVVVHSGQANSGHYYAFVKDRRRGNSRRQSNLFKPKSIDKHNNDQTNGQSRLAEHAFDSFQPDGDADDSRWFKFNDTHVSEAVNFGTDDTLLAEECFGGKYSTATDNRQVTDPFTNTASSNKDTGEQRRAKHWSAYLLFYERCDVTRANRNHRQGHSSRPINPTPAKQLDRSNRDSVTSTTSSTTNPAITIDGSPPRSKFQLSTSYEIDDDDDMDAVTLGALPQAPSSPEPTTTTSNSAHNNDVRRLTPHRSMDVTTTPNPNGQLTMPSRIFNEIRSRNSTFTRDRHVFSGDYFAFIRRLCQDSLTTFDSITGEEDQHRRSLLATRLLTHFLASTYLPLHAKVKASIELDESTNNQDEPSPRRHLPTSLIDQLAFNATKRWTVLWCQLAASSSRACSWLLDYLVTSPIQPCVLYMLLTPRAANRQLTASALLSILRHYHSILQPSPSPSRTTSTTTNSATDPTLVRLLDHLVAILDQPHLAREHLTHAGHLFALLRAYASPSTSSKLAKSPGLSLMLHSDAQLQLTTRLLSFFMTRPSSSLDGSPPRLVLSDENQRELPGNSSDSEADEEERRCNRPGPPSWCDCLRQWKSTEQRELGNLYYLTFKLLLNTSFDAYRVTTEPIQPAASTQPADIALTVNDDNRNLATSTTTFTNRMIAEALPLPSPNLIGWLGIDDSDESLHSTHFVGLFRVGELICDAYLANPATPLLVTGILDDSLDADDNEEETDQLSLRQLALDLMLHFCTRWWQASFCFITALLSRIESRPQHELRSYFDILTQLLRLSDQLQTGRIAGVLDGLIQIQSDGGEECFGQSLPSVKWALVPNNNDLNWPMNDQPLGRRLVRSSSPVTTEPDDRVNEQLPASNLTRLQAALTKPPHGKGLLDLILTESSREPRRAYACMKYIVELANELPAVSSYLVRYPQRLELAVDWLNQLLVPSTDDDASHSSSNRIVSTSQGGLYMHVPVDPSTNTAPSPIDLARSPSNTDNYPVNNRDVTDSAFHRTFSAQTTLNEALQLLVESREKNPVLPSHRQLDHASRL